jgi:hypothetical protein
MNSNARLSGIFELDHKEGQPVVTKSELKLRELAFKSRR